MGKNRKHKEVVKGIPDPYTGHFIHSLFIKYIKPVVTYNRIFLFTSSCLSIGNSVFLHCTYIFIVCLLYCPSKNLNCTPINLNRSVFISANTPFTGSLFLTVRQGRNPSQRLGARYAATCSSLVFRVFWKCVEDLPQWRAPSRVLVAQKRLHFTTFTSWFLFHGLSFALPQCCCSLKGCILSKFEALCN